jgi:hypothetical protein
LGQDDVLLLQGQGYSAGRTELVVVVSAVHWYRTTSRIVSQASLGLETDAFWLDVGENCLGEAIPSPS